MRIRYFHVENFRSLGDFTMEDIGDINILIGRNGSGKSNILEALDLFISGVSANIYNQDASVPDYIWTRQSSNNSIIFSCIFEFDGSEISLTEDVLRSLNAWDKRKHIIEVTRVLSRTPKKEWQWKKLTINHIQIYHEGAMSEKYQNKESEDYKALVKMVTEIAAIVKDSFKLIGFERVGTSKGKAPGQRQPSIPAPTIQGIVEIESSPAAEIDKLSLQLKDTFREMFPGQELIVTGQHIMVREGSSRMPLQLLGVGTQTVIGLIKNVIDGGKVICIEEPEIHLHADLQRKVFSMIIGLANKAQLFITTHSTVFLDECDYENIWHIVKKEGNTNALRIRSFDALRNVALQLGVRPSDVFLSNRILFVEGISETIIFPAWARLMGKSLSKPYVNIIPMGGAGKGRYHLGVWNEIAEVVDVPRYMILDGDKNAKNEVKRILDKGLLSASHIRTLDRMTIEDYYPKRLIIEFIKNEYNLDESEIDALNKLLESITANESVLKAIQKYLYELKDETNSSWKIQLAYFVAAEMSPNDLDDDIRNLILNIEHAFGNLRESSVNPKLPSKDDEVIRATVSPQNRADIPSNLKEFFDLKEPQTHMDKVLLFYYWITKTTGNTWITYDQISGCYDKLALPKPSRIRDVVRKLASKGLLLRGEEDGLFRISMHGEKHIEDELL